MTTIRFLWLTGLRALLDISIVKVKNKVFIYDYVYSDSKLMITGVKRLWAEIIHLLESLPRKWVPDY